MQKLSGTGVWAHQLRFGEPAAVQELGAGLESLGYTALWIPDVGGDVTDALDRLLEATSTVTVATGILNIWRHDPAVIAAWFTALPDDRRGRVLLGLGVSHGPLIGERWQRPLEAMGAFLDRLDAGGVPREQLCIGALGPRMLELAARRTGGAHPYLVSPEHTARAREVLQATGLDAGLYVEQGVVLETDADAARAVGRTALDHYVGLPNYTSNWKRLGFTDNDIATRSDALIDALVAWGDADTVRERIEAHRRAGADHVCIQVLGAAGPLEVCRELAPR